ncbi:Ankyrin repeat-containing domain protein [Lactarius tabidus]
MSQTSPTPSSSSNLQAIFVASLKEYEKKTKNDLLTHPLMAQFQTCNSPADILAVLRAQVQQFEQSSSRDDKLTKWLSPTINVLYAFSSTLGAGVGLVFSPANVIFAGAGVLLSAAKDVIASQDALIDIFERIENFFRRLEEYAEVPTTDAMKDIIVKIMVEVLGIFAIMTKEMKQGRTKKYLKKLIGRRDIEDALSRLDRLTQEEARMATAQVLKVAHRVENEVGTVGNQVRGIDDKVNVAVEDGKETKALMQQAANNMDEERRTRVRADHRKWLSPPDPSTNQNIASGTQHEGTATWFFRGSIFVEWKSKSTTSLLWIHGKPGSGKSILCSAIIQDIMALREAGLATMAYFYFDFRDTDKQNLHNALPSLLTQLSARSDSCCEILSRSYKAHDDGARKPSTSTMIESLKEMLVLPGHGPVYIILDALDECPNTSGIPPARKQVLNLLQDLVGLQLPNLHICVTSRPEIDIRAALEPLAFHSVSIHDQIGQRKDIEDYIRSVVHADSDAAIGRWRDRDKALVIETLTKRADGMFRWVFCQLEVLQHCFPQSIRRTLNELPNSLDETYERVLKEIGMANRGHAHRLLQCLTVAIRPLRVDELAEILALDFDVAEGMTPELNVDWRWKDQQRAVLSACSSLITLVDDGDSRVIQFSHFSVKEFLTSDRLSTSTSGVLHFHITPEPAHTTFAQACLATLLQLDGSSTNDQAEDRFPLARYASQHWVEHAQFGMVSSRIEDGMRRLFDPAQPYLASWLQLHDVDDVWFSFGKDDADRGSLLYYASLCGFRDLAARIIVDHPEQVNARGGRNHSPLAAALYKRHFNVAELLRHHGAAVDVPGYLHRTPLLAASQGELVDVGRWLLDHGADADLQNDDHESPILKASGFGSLELVRMLLEHGVRINSVDDTGHTSLHLASEFGHMEIMRLLIECGADIDAQAEDGLTPLHEASSHTHLVAANLKVIQLLLDHDADIDAEDKEGSTPLHRASSKLGTDTISLLLDRGANPNAKDRDGWTPLHLASSNGYIETVRLLLELGANANTKDKDGWTPLHLASSKGHAETVRLLLDRAANANSEDKEGWTPLHLAASDGYTEIVGLLLEHGANTNAEDNEGWTPLHLASSDGHATTVRLLLERGANADAKNKKGRAPLQIASTQGMDDTVQILTEHGARVDGEL